MANITNEKGVKAEVKKLLDKHGWFWFMPPANGYGKAGISDFLAIKNGVFLAVETKFGKNKPSPMQVGFCNSIRSQQGFAFIVNETSLGWLDTWLTAFNNATQAVQTANGIEPEKAVAAEDGADMLNAIKVLTEML